VRCPENKPDKISTPLTGHRTVQSHSQNQNREHGLRLPAQDPVPATGHRALAATQRPLVKTRGVWY